MIRLAKLALPLAILAGCGEPPPVANPSPFDEDDPAAESGDVSAEPDLPVVYAVDEDSDEPAAEGRPAVIDKEALHKVLAAGPGAYAGAVMIEAVVDSGDLRGWRLTRWEVPWAGLAVGEVVVDVNGVAIVRPDDLMELWESLWEATEIAIRLRGDGGDEIRRFAVR